MGERTLIDISQAVGAQTGAWPGDTRFSSRWTWSMSRGDSCNVSAIQTSPHVGTHADAPLHFDPTGPGIGAVELDRYCGPCWVMDGPPQGLIEPALLRAWDAERFPRLLLRTRSQGDTSFPETFTALSPEAAALLAQRNARLVGLDTPSVDPFASKELPAHNTLARARVAILENLVLHHVTPGAYELIALPLRWEGLDASPVRAALRQL